MQTNALPDVVAGGIDQRYTIGQNSGENVQNYRYLPDGGWRKDRGWEPLIKYPASGFTLSAAELAIARAPCRFLAVWSRHGGSEEYYIQERAGILSYTYGNVGTATTAEIVLATNRHLPRADEPGTQFVPFGRFALLLNGNNEMFKWWGRAKLEPFGFILPTPTPYCVNVQVDYAAPTAVNPVTGLEEIIGDPLNNALNGIAVQFAAGDYLGLGSPDKGAINSYSYRQTYVTDTGSESPVSNPADVSWTIRTDTNATGATVAERLRSANANARKYGVLVQGLEPGPDGTVARRIYRTKNTKDGLTGAGDLYFFVCQIDDNTTRQYLDCIPDNQLVIAAPTFADSVTISSGYKYGAAWNGAMWLAGGDTTPTQIIYSVQGLPEQFPAFNYFDVGVRDGGQITAVVPYYDVLLVFREKAIDAVFTNANGDGFTCTTVNQSIGTIATNTIRLVPGVGILFLNLDGVYLITGGLRGGASITVTKVSARFEKELSRVSKNSLCRATAVYSAREKEWWCHYPVDGQTENTRGVVFAPEVNEFTLRSNAYPESPVNDWRFTQLAADRSGYIIIGTQPSQTSNNLAPGMGLQVWTARQNSGDSMPFTVFQTVATVLYTGAAAPIGVWQSGWEDFGDDTVKKRVLTVDIETITEGNNEVELFWASDYSSEFVSAGTVAPKIGDYLNGIGPAQDATLTSGANLATWDVSKYQDHKVTRMRWDVNTGLISHFAFRLQSANKHTLIKYKIMYIGGTVKTPNTKMPGAKS
jgi:hypothetical protein